MEAQGMMPAEQVRVMGICECARLSGIDRRSLQRIAKGEREPHQHVAEKIKAAYRQMLSGIGGKLTA